MDQQPNKRSHLGRALTLLGGALGVFGVIAMNIGLKATIDPGVNVVLIRSVLSLGGLVTFGLAVGLIMAGAIVGRRMTRQKDEGPVEHQAQTDPLLSEGPGFPETGVTSTFDAMRQHAESKSSSSSSS
jgi:hypothetical protein